MQCAPDPERYGPDIVVHRFDMAAMTCRCGGMAVKVPEPKQKFNHQVYGQKGHKRGPRRKRKVEADPW